MNDLAMLSSFQWTTLPISNFESSGNATVVITQILGSAATKTRIALTIVKAFDSKAALKEEKSACPWHRQQQKTFTKVENKKAPFEIVLCTVETKPKHHTSDGTKTIIAWPFVWQGDVCVGGVGAPRKNTRATNGRLLGFNLMLATFVPVVALSETWVTSLGLAAKLGNRYTTTLHAN